MYLSERQNDRRKEEGGREMRGKKRNRGISHILTHSPDGHKSQFWASLKPGARTPSEFPMWVSRTQVLGPSAVAFLDTLVGSWIGSSWWASRE